MPRGPHRQAKGTSAGYGGEGPASFKLGSCTLELSHLFLAPGSSHALRDESFATPAAMVRRRSAELEPVSGSTNYALAVQTFAERIALGIVDRDPLFCHHGGIPADVVAMPPSLKVVVMKLEEPAREEPEV